MRQNHGHKDEDVFRPLVKADGLKEDFERFTPIVELTGDGNLPRFELRLKREAGVGEHRLSGMLEERYVRGSIADVVKPHFGEAAAEAFEFIVSGKVGRSVTGQDFLEDAQVLGDAVGESRVGTSGEVQLAAIGVLFAEVIEQRPVVGQVGRIELDLRADLGFQRGLSSAQPEGRTQGTERIRANQQEERIDQGIALDECAVKIDTERSPGADTNGFFDNGLTHC